jgi:hypothetical protein
MKAARLSLVTLICASAALALSACTQEPTVAQEFDAAKAAVRPSSDTAAQTAVAEYFATTFNLSGSARYATNPLVNTVVRDPGLHAAGWFMCGTVTTKTSHGVDGPVKPFYAYFDPKVADTVQKGAVESGDYEIVSHWCREIYGTVYLPEYEELSRVK